jgi:protein-disulfide isomerase
MSKTYFIIITVALILVAGLYVVSQTETTNSLFTQATEENNDGNVVFVTDEGQTVEVSDESVEAEIDTDDTETAADTTTQETEIEPAEGTATSPFLPLKEHAKGDADAPVTIHEFSSLSCSHCGAFHTDTYPTLIEEYVETGKARLVIIDFPTNLPALEGTMLAHCVPQDSYFDFVQILFTTQSDWINEQYREHLITTAGLAGLSREEALSCLNDNALKEAVLKRTEESSQQLGIQSTPSFILNNGAAKIIGNKPYEEFKQAIDELLGEDAPKGDAEN